MREGRYVGLLFPFLESKDLRIVVKPSPTSINVLRLNHVVLSPIRKAAHEDALVRPVGGAQGETVGEIARDEIQSQPQLPGMMSIQGLYSLCQA